jgi:DNA repair protein RAD50
LRFTNAAGNVMVLVRSMELKQNKTKLSFSALDGVLRTTDAAGKRVSMSHKCNELDRQIPMLLGVSKPILEHVVFCHQEESSWPLMDSSELKKRFDAIFDSTRYTKALKNIDEIKKGYRDKVKDYKADLAGLGSHKHAVKGFRKDLDSQQAELESLEEKIDECRSDIKEAEKLIEQHHEVISRVEEVQSELDEKEIEFQTENTVLENHKSYLDEDMTGKHSARELKDMLRDFEEQAEKRVEKKEDLERDRQKLRDEIDDVGRDANKLMSEQGRLASDKARYQELLKQRLTKMEEIAAKWGIELAVTQSQTQNNSSFVSQGAATVAGDASFTSGSQGSVLIISEGDMQSFVKALGEKEEALKEELKEHKSRARDDEDVIQKSFSMLSAENMTFESGE